PGAVRVPRPQQAQGGGDHAARPRRTDDGDGAGPAGGRPLSRGPARRDDGRPDPAHQRRGLRRARRPSPLRSAARLPGQGPPRARRGDPGPPPQRCARGRRAARRGRGPRAGGGQQFLAGAGAARRQAPRGAAVAGGGGPSRVQAAPCGPGPGDHARAGAGRVPAPHRARGAGAAGGPRDAPSAPAPAGALPAWSPPMTSRRRTTPRPAHLEGLDRYEPGLSLEQASRESGLREVVKLASNENPLGPSPRALEAVRAALVRIHRYPDGPATALRAALARGLGVDASQVVIGNGSTDLIDLLARAFLGPEDNAVISEGAFARFAQVVRARNGRARLVPMRDYTHDLAAMRAAADARTRLVYVANPNNPTGTWNRKRELLALLADLPPEVLVVLDEAYFEYADDPDYPDGVAFVREGRPVAVLRT